MYTIYALSQERPNGHIFSGLGGISRTYEMDLRQYLVFENDDFENDDCENMIAFIYGEYIRIPSGNWKYAPFGDLSWSEWQDEHEDPQEWYQEALRRSKTAFEMEEEFQNLLHEGYSLYCLTDDK